MNLTQIFVVSREELIAIGVFYQKNYAQSKIVFAFFEHICNTDEKVILAQHEVKSLSKFKIFSPF